MACSHEDVKFRLISQVLAGKLGTGVLTNIANNDESGQVLFSYFIAHPLDVINSALDFTNYITPMVAGWSTDDQMNQVW